MRRSRHAAPDAGPGETLEMRIHSVERGRPEGGYQPVQLATDRGPIDCRFYAADSTARGVVWVGGVGGGWDSPADNLYPRLCRELQQQGIASARVRFRAPGNLDESVLDTLASAAYLDSEGVRALALVGHSFGGAVVVRAAAADPAVRTVVTLATQCYGAEPVTELAPRCSLLAVHGNTDTLLPPFCSEQVYEWAGEPKRLLLLDGAGHGLDEAAEEVRAAVTDWVVSALRAAPR